MVHPSLSALLWLGVTGATSISATATEQPSEVVADAVILECKSIQTCKLVAKAVEERGGKLRYSFNSDIFIGLSIQVPNVTIKEEIRALAESKGIEGEWPVQWITQVAEGRVEEQEQLEKKSEVAPKTNKWHRRLGGLADDSHVQSPWTHHMTHIDKLHEEGYTGNGIKIAVVDTGVDYTHPALGGCFGPGCRVVMGENFSNQGAKSDPKDCNGHGTMVAGILAGYDKAAGFVGAAPNATIMAYRVYDCIGIAKTDDIIAAFLKAKEDGAQIIVSSLGLRGGRSWAETPAAMVVSRIVASGISCVIALGNEAEKGLFNAESFSSGRGVIAVNSVSRSHKGLTDIARLSAYGPTWNLDIKPNLLAPGEEVPVLLRRGGYGTSSGTSFAGPLVGGIYALVAEAQCTLDPTVLNSLIIGTAEPQAGDNGYISVAQQGGGLAQAWQAAHSRTLVEPAGLVFNDTAHRVSSISLRIHNKANTTVEYQLSDISAVTLYALAQGSTETGEIRDDQRVQASAKIHLNKTSVTLGPNESATIDISASDPNGLDVQRLPVWSGWIAINSSDNSLLTVPYLGLRGSLSEAIVLAPGPVQLSVGEHSLIARPENSTYAVKDPPASTSQQLPGSIPVSYRPNGGPVIPGQPAANFKVALSSPEVQVHIVPLSICPGSSMDGTAPMLNLTRACVPMTSVAEVGGISSIGQVTNFPKYNVGSGELNVVWNGSLPSGWYAPPGRYKLVARALSIMGEPKVESHWQVAESPDFTLMYESNW